MKLWTGQGINYKILTSLSVTVTFDIELWVLYLTHLHIIRNIFTKYHEDTTIACEVMAWTMYKLPSFDLWPPSVTFTFDIESWLLYVTHLLIMIYISKLTKLFENASMTFEVTARTRSDARTIARTDTQKLQIVATMYLSPQAGTTKRILKQILL